MRNERGPFTLKEEAKINNVVSQLTEGGEDAIDCLRDRRRAQMNLAYEIGLKGGSFQDMQAATGRSIDLANEAIERAQSIIEKDGLDRVSQLITKGQKR